MTSRYNARCVEVYMSWRRGRKLTFVTEAQATGATLQVFEEIRSALAVPHVDLLFQSYAAFPRFLELFWRAAKPTLETQEFFDLSYRLGSDAYTRACSYFEVPDLGTTLRQNGAGEAQVREVSAAVDLFQYNNPLLLLLTAAQAQAFEGMMAPARGGTRPASHATFEQTAGTSDDGGSPEFRRMFDDIRQTLGVPAVNTEYRAFARWPEFLKVYWSILKPLARSPIYAECQRRVEESAVALAGELPEPPQLSIGTMEDAGMSEDEITAVVQTTETFLHVQSGSVLNTAVARIALDGGNPVVRSRRPGEAAA